MDYGGNRAPAASDPVAPSEAGSLWAAVRRICAVGVFAYFVVVASLWWRDGGAGVFLLNAVASAGLIGYYVVKAPTTADRLDRLLLGAFTAFSIVCAFSQFPRQSFDSAMLAWTYLAGLFALREVLRHSAARRLFVVGMRGLSVLLTIIVAIQLLGGFIEWWALTGWSTLPPLDLRLRPEPWLLHYEVVLGLVILYPSWWIGGGGRWRAAMAIPIGLLVFVCCVVVGSRSIWLAVLVASAAVLFPVLRKMNRRPRNLLVTAAVSLLVATLVMAPEFWATLGDRVARSASISERTSVWGPALGQWLERPLFGVGPGSFPWVLQGTGYFDTHSYTPRQPDNALVHLIVEGGLLMLIVGLVTCLALAAAVLRTGSRPAFFVVTVWLVAGLGINTVTSGLLMPIVAGWLALTLPHAGQSRPSAPRPASWRSRMMVPAAIVAGTAFLATVVGAVTYSSARAAVSNGDLASAEGALELAAALDPGLAIYHRQLGTTRLMAGAPVEAIAPLERATQLNPADDLAWRALGLAFAELGRPAAARAAVRNAVETQRSDPTNLLLFVGLRRDDKPAGERERLLGEIVQAWPTVVAAPAFDDWSGYAVARLVVAGGERWHKGRPSPEPQRYQPLLLRAMGSESAGTAEQSEAPLLQDAYLAVMMCRSDATEALRSVPGSERRHPTYWELQVRLARLHHDTTSQLERLHSIMTNSPILSDESVMSSSLNPLHENDPREASPDTWGYRRWPIEWPATRWDLPSPTAGFARWHNTPREAAQDAGLPALAISCSAPR